LALSTILTYLRLVIHQQVKEYKDDVKPDRPACLSDLWTDRGGDKDYGGKLEALQIF